MRSETVDDESLRNHEVVMLRMDPSYETNSVISTCMVISLTRIVRTSRLLSFTGSFQIYVVSSFAAPVIWLSACVDPLKSIIKLPGIHVEIVFDSLKYYCYLIIINTPTCKKSIHQKLQC